MNWALIVMMVSRGSVAIASSTTVPMDDIATCQHAQQLIAQYQPTWETVCVRTRYEPTR